MLDPTSPWTPFQPQRQWMRPLETPAGRRYRVAVSLPDGPPPPDGWPSLVVLDGHRLFQAVAATASALAMRPEKTGVRPLAVIGVFHDETQGSIEDARALDFTDTPCPEPDWTRPSGGAEAFRRFLIEQAWPAATQAAPLDGDRRALIGHSLGGLFVLETLEQRPDLFARWISLSPSLWWRTPAVDNADDRLLLGYGEGETGRDMRGRIEAWAAEAGGDGHAPRLRMAAGADHGSAPFALIPEALRHASGA
ncbi:alpha/beta hydrolase-fold protein [uncultured Brevundimonas sp.]|uniref:alpha/beta hydrolase n=1 Tax=uncultured Brevundimonas sp. TaxID=213418 RepID=UPI0025917321|nr:alpha/beta hydrolase-fold protein [uncultured Brevundimonas sp.]